MVCLLTIEHHDFFAIQDVAIARFCGGCLAIVQREAALALHVGKRAQHLPTNDARQPLSLLRFTAGACNQPAEQHHSGEIRFHHQALTQFLHHH